ncbi:MAG: GTP-binding protein [Burkholderiaceae bacterium]
MNFERDPLAGKIPVTLITGFLGSGKTTLISRLVKHPDMNRVAVVINEIGEIGIDHDLVTLSSENITLLANGCICCSVRTDMQETLRELFAQRRAGLMADFDRVIVETTGLADPAPVVQTLVSDTLLAAQYRLDGVVTLVDALHGLHQLEHQPEAVKQIALADRIFITKSDMLSTSVSRSAGDAQGADQVEAIKAAVMAINPNAGVSLIINGEVEPRALTHLGLASARASVATLSFLGESLNPSSLENHPSVPSAASERYLGTRPPLHDPSITTASLRFEAPFTWAGFSSALDLLATLRGPDLLRVKGIVNVEGQPVVVQGVQHIFHPPVHLDRWPSADTQTRMVFITRKISAETIRNLFQAVGAVGIG